MIVALEIVFYIPYFEILYASFLLWGIRVIILTQNGALYSLFLVQVNFGLASELVPLAYRISICNGKLWIKCCFCNDLPRYRKLEFLVLVVRSKLYAVLAIGTVKLVKFISCTLYMAQKIILWRNVFWDFSYNHKRLYEDPLAVMKFLKLQPSLCCRHFVCNRKLARLLVIMGSYKPP